MHCYYWMHVFCRPLERAARFGSHPPALPSLRHCWQTETRSYSTFCQIPLMLVIVITIITDMIEIIIVVIIAIIAVIILFLNHFV